MTKIPRICLRNLCLPCSSAIADEKYHKHNIASGLVSRLWCETFLCTILCTMLLLFTSSLANARILFQDSFDDWPANWTCSNTSDTSTLNLTPHGWLIGGCGWTDGFGSEFKIGSGSNGTQGLQIFKKKGVPNGYRGEVDHWLYGDDVVREIYHSWSMKVPIGFDKYTAEGGEGKFWRYILDPNGVWSPFELYLLSRGPRLSTNPFTITTFYYGVTNNYAMIPHLSDISDGKWHNYQLHLKLNSTSKYVESIGITTNSNTKTIYDSNSKLGVFTSGDTICFITAPTSESDMIKITANVVSVDPSGRSMVVDNLSKTVTSMKTGEPSRLWIPNPDGVIELFMDGKLIYSNIHCDFKVSDYEKFYRFGVGFGNSGSPDWMMDDWVSLDIDDVIVATELMNTSPIISKVNGLRSVKD